MTELVVIGGGITGMTAAIAVRRQGHSCAVIDPVHGGGQLANIAGVTNYSGCEPGTTGSDLAAALLEEAVAVGCDLHFGEVDSLTHQDKIWHVGGSNGHLDASAVIVATGSTLARLGVPGEVEFKGRGVISCATCDGWAFKGKRICVVGGGDSAVDEALYLGSLAERVTLVYSGPALSANPDGVRRLADLPQIDQIPHATISEIIGRDTVQAVRVRHLLDGEQDLLQVEGVGVYVGLRPNSMILQSLIPLSSDGHALTDMDLRSRIAGLFVAGDVRAGCTALFESCREDGFLAARSAAAYLRAGQ